MENSLNEKKGEKGQNIRLSIDYVSSVRVCCVWLELIAFTNYSKDYFQRQLKSFSSCFSFSMREAIKKLA